MGREERNGKWENGEGEEESEGETGEREIL